MYLASRILDAFDRAFGAFAVVAPGGKLSGVSRAELRLAAGCAVSRMLLTAATGVDIAVDGCRLFFLFAHHPSHRTILPQYYLPLFRA
jgi:hypothetical protein